MRALLALLLAGSASADSPLFDGSAAARALAKPEPVESAAGAPAESEPNVILITWDGVRREEFFVNRPDRRLEKSDTAELFPKFWGARRSEGTVWGDPNGGSGFGISNIGVLSLPAYQSIMAGSAQRCVNNNCGRIKSSTFPERLVKELGLPREKVAVVASWPGIALAVEKKEGAIYVDAGKGGKTRNDFETWPIALSYLKEKRPRFFYISLNDSDDFGHAGDYPSYLRMLRAYDGWLDELFTTLDQMGAYGKNTTVLLTTDHGRGHGQDWKNHNPLRPMAARIFLFARGPRVKKGAQGSGVRSHADIRPTVEKLLGLKPRSCLLCGDPLSEALSAPKASSPAPGS